MKLWVLEQRDGYGWDEYGSKVIRARTEEKARAIANVSTGDEGKIWSDKKLVSCERVFVGGEEGEILGSFNAS